MVQCRGYLASPRTSPSHLTPVYLLSRIENRMRSLWRKLAVAWLGGVPSPALSDEVVPERASIEEQAALHNAFSPLDSSEHARRQIAAMIREMHNRSCGPA